MDMVSFVCKQKTEIDFVVVLIFRIIAQFQSWDFSKFENVNKI